jgi:hypothetical protein
MNDIADILFEFAFGAAQSIPNLRSQGFTTINASSIPTFDAGSEEFLALMFKVLLACRITEDNATVFETLNIVLHHMDNLTVFRQTQGFLFLLRTFVAFSSVNGHYLHTQLMSCFELFIPNMMYVLTPCGHLTHAHVDQKRLTRTLTSSSTLNSSSEQVPKRSSSTRSVFSLCILLSTASTQS